MSDLIDRDEVIEIIEHVCSTDDTYWKPGTLEKIRDLPTHPTPSNTLGALDCIDRREAIKAILGEPPEVNYPIYYAEKIRGLPFVQPEERCIATITLSGEDIERIVKEQVEEIKDSLPREGTWICQADDDIWNCSECDFEIDGTGCIDPLEYLKTYKFCPNCGADMREGDAE